MGWRVVPGVATTARLALLAVAWPMFGPAAAQEAAGAERAEERRAMIAAIERDVERSARELGKSRLSAAVMRAVAEVPRHEFVSVELRPWAYDNRPLPIGSGQTISQPTIVAMMTDLLEVGAGDRVLEIGAGSGYQAAVLAELVGHVYTIEIVEELARSAAERLERLGYGNVSVRAGDGYHGWPEQAPFDGIIVTAGAEEVPQPLVDQLATGGRMVIPVGPQNRIQHLVVLTKRPDGSVDRREIIPVAFVPFTRARD